MVPIRRINELRHPRAAPSWQRNYAVSPNTGASPTVGATHASPLQRSTGPLKRSLGAIVGSYKRTTVTGHHAVAHETSLRFAAGAVFGPPNSLVNSTGCRMVPIRRINELRHPRAAPSWQRNYAVSPNTGASPTVGATHASPLQRSTGPLKRSLGAIVGSYKRTTVTGHHAVAHETSLRFAARAVFGSPK